MQFNMNVTQNYYPFRTYNKAKIENLNLTPKK